MPLITDTDSAVATTLTPQLDGGGNPHALALRANKLDLLERLADDLAHEIKNPLHSMVINLEVLKRRVARADAADEVQRYIGVLAGELERVNRRIELLLRLSRPGRGPESTSLAELCDELMELIQLEARHADAAVDYQPGSGARVLVAREPARQVILNLVLEVIDHLPRGGTLRITLDDREGQSQLSVGGPPTDSGYGGSARVQTAAALAGQIGGRVLSGPGGEDPCLAFTLPLAHTAG